MKKTFVLMSDTHGHTYINVPPGDFLIHAGDATSDGNDHDLKTFYQWLGRQPHAHKIFVPGNHDWGLYYEPEAYKKYGKRQGVHTLIDEDIKLDGFWLYGSPWQPRFKQWAFNMDQKELAEKWTHIPEGLDVLITHTPPYGILDFVDRRARNVGCEELGKRLAAVQPQLHVFGHIHECFGIQRVHDTTYVNSSICTVEYQPTRVPIVMDLNPMDAGLEATG